MTTAETIHPLRLATPLALFFALFFAVPLVLLFGVSLQTGEGNAVGLTQYARFFADGLGARVLFRTAAQPSLLPGRLPDELLRQWRYHAGESEAYTRADRSSIYGGVHLYSLIG